MNEDCKPFEMMRQAASAAKPDRSNADNNDDKSMSGGTSEKQEALAVLRSTKAFFEKHNGSFTKDLNAIAKATAKDFEAFQANLQGVLQKTTPQEPEEEKDDENGHHFLQRAIIKEHVAALATRA